jgi:hypothetical protein
MRQTLAQTLRVMLDDRRFAWDQNEDGTYTRLTPSPDADPDSAEALGTFEWLMREARNRPIIE